MVSEFKNELVYEGIVCRRERAKAADGINCIEVGQAVGKLPIAFYLTTKKEAQALFDSCPQEGEKVRVRAQIQPRQKVGKGDKVVSHVSFQVGAIEGLALGAVGDAMADLAGRRKAA